MLVLSALIMIDDSYRSESDSESDKANDQVLANCCR